MIVRQLINRALRMLRVIASGETPTADELADALSAYNAMISSMRGHGVGPALRPMIRENGYAVAGGLYDEAALITPLKPFDGARFGVSGACTVTTDLTIEGGSVSVPTVWFYRADKREWIFEAFAAVEDDPQFPEEFHEGLAALLAVRMPEYGAELTPQIVGLADECMSNLMQRYRPRINPGCDLGVLRMSRQSHETFWR